MYLTSRSSDAIYGSKCIPIDKPTFKNRQFPFNKLFDMQKQQMHCYDCSSGKLVLLTSSSIPVDNFLYLVNKVPLSNARCLIMCAKLTFQKKTVKHDNKCSEFS